MNNQKTVIVGGVAGGATAAARLRRINEHAHIILIERGEHISFANCGLPYYIGGTIEKRGKLLVQTVEKMKEKLKLDIRIKSEVRQINRKKKTVNIIILRTGEEYEETHDTFLAQNMMEGNLESVQWDEIDSIIASGKYVLDVRDKAELKGGILPGSAHIPLDRLRDWLVVLPQEETIYIYCQSGLRGYLAGRILQEHGFKVKNLAGGYKTYSIAKGERILAHRNAVQKPAII